MPWLLAMKDFILFPLGDHAITLSLGDQINQADHFKIMAMKRWLEENRFSGQIDVITAYSSITVIYDVYQTNAALSEGSVFEWVKGHMVRSFHESVTQSSSPNSLKRIPVCYDGSFGLDLEHIAMLQNISKEKIVELHTTVTYQVYMIGFLPGFPYMGKVPDLLVMPRKEKPRSNIQAGSVGLAGAQTGIYPVNSPGGWQIIGRTPIALFGKHLDPPVKLEAGDRVQFYSISKDEFETLSNPLV